MYTRRGQGHKQSESMGGQSNGTRQGRGLRQSNGQRQSDRHRQSKDDITRWGRWAQAERQAQAE
jgi:hypothetical protein